MPSTPVSRSRRSRTPGSASRQLVQAALSSGGVRGACHSGSSRTRPTMHRPRGPPSSGTGPRTGGGWSRAPKLSRPPRASRSSKPTCRNCCRPSSGCTAGSAIPNEVARFLTLYNPPRVVRACTQIMLDTEDGPVLLRSYDHHPETHSTACCSCEAIGTARRPLAMTDCIWGALDGINGHGLAIALAFGGRNTIGDGFAAPLICRYMLETCSDGQRRPRQALARLPVYMPYTFACSMHRGRLSSPRSWARMSRRRSSSGEHREPSARDRLARATPALSQSEHRLAVGLNLC
jgi:hypothetical protein